MSRGAATPPAQPSGRREAQPGAEPARQDKSPIPLLIAWFLVPLLLVLLLTKFDLGEWILNLFGA